MNALAWMAVAAGAAGIGYLLGKTGRPECRRTGIPENRNTEGPGDRAAAAGPPRAGRRLHQGLPPGRAAGPDGLTRREPGTRHRASKKEADAECHTH